MSAQPSLAFISNNETDRQQIDAAWAPLKTTVVFDTYWILAAKRQGIFFARFKNESPPWTTDPILKTYKFTNAYRASDRVSQYLIREVIYKGDQSPREIFFRTLLFKLFNRIETWELLSENFGSPSSRDYRFAHYDRILSQAMSRGEKLYSAAYIMPSGGKSFPCKRKHQMHLQLLERMLSDSIYTRLTDSQSMGDAFALLRGYPTIGDFLAYQYVTDLNYSASMHLSEMEFTCAGPGAKSGIAKCFKDKGGLSDTQIIEMMCVRQKEEFLRLGLQFQDLWGRKLQLIDCQNLFCEVDKYSRVAHPEFSGVSGRTRIKQKFHPRQARLKPWYPPKWELNDRIEREWHDNQP
ncbi:hypothetical protein DES53_10377 [Roseimicrobium gellanilyticum]|uniref:5-hmdU DNA kinase helical domain-containing protein n=1 Tax=Roseimicrobium gellanilyticum TaxID=748857 RepID=A0A366HNY6_9BACT|nr:nucleotide kinase domain-containing protein [Roseimicrobium gellanilyticum]RBP45081.1 hypothetical protein DES53_10377 [Roseimicrobium gellanilyticum]